MTLIDIVDVTRDPCGPSVDDRDFVEIGGRPTGLLVPGPAPIVGPQDGALIADDPRPLPISGVNTGKIPVRDHAGVALAERRATARVAWLGLLCAGRSPQLLAGFLVEADDLGIVVVADSPLGRGQGERDQRVLGLVLP